jgi:cation diffusion facilitator CzcD-associated flavoprotein CzcO
MESLPEGSFASMNGRDADESRQAGRSDLPKHIHEVVIIGSGLAGLTAAHGLRQHGIAAVILERERDIGSSWARRHPQLTLNTHRDLSTLPDFAYPAGTPAFPKRDAVVRHLQAFAETHAFDIRHGVEVTGIRRDRAYYVVTANGAEMWASHVIIATGRDAQGALPAWPGLETFTGQILHSRDFGDARAYEGRSVLVIGGGNSGFDLLNHLGRIKTGPIWFAVRRGPSVLPKRLFRFSVHRLSPLMQRLPTRVVDRMIAATQWLAFGRLSRLGFPKGKADAASRLVRDHIAIPVDDGAIAAIRKGQITVVKAVKAFQGDRVILMDGREIRPDVVLVATGYETSLPLAADVQPGAAVKGEPGLWFIGMTPSLTSYFRETQREAADIAKAISAMKT